MGDLHNALVAAVNAWRDATWTLGATAFRICEADLERLEEHRPAYQIPAEAGGTRWVCASRCREVPCAEVRRIARVYGVEIPEEDRNG